MGLNSGRANPNCRWEVVWENYSTASHPPTRARQRRRGGPGRWRLVGREREREKAAKLARPGWHRLWLMISPVCPYCCSWGEGGQILLGLAQEIGNTQPELLDRILIFLIKLQCQAPRVVIIWRGELDHTWSSPGQRTDVVHYSALLYLARNYPKVQWLGQLSLTANTSLSLTTTAPRSCWERMRNIDLDELVISQVLCWLGLVPDPGESCPLPSPPPEHTCRDPLIPGPGWRYDRT